MYEIILTRLPGNTCTFQLKEIASYLIADMLKVGGIHIMQLLRAAIPRHRTFQTFQEAVALKSWPIQKILCISNNMQAKCNKA